MNTYITAAIIVLIILIFIGIYNNLIRKRNETDNAFGSVDTMLKKRYDLIPNLVETVKQYMYHEADVLKDITRLRSGLSDSKNNEEKLNMHNEMAHKLNNLILVSESYPDLKASKNFIQLQASWNEAEEQISASRRFYNAAVTSYNNAIQTFPSNIIAGLFGFSSKKVFEINEVERKNISAKDLF